MKKIIYYFSVTIFVFIFFTISYLTIFGLETSHFNKEIERQVKNINQNFDLEIKKIKIVLEPINLKIKLKTLGPKLKFKKENIEIESIKSEISLRSLIRNEFLISNIEISTNSTKIKKVSSFIREIYNDPKLIILENFIKKGYLIADINLEFDTNGEIKDNFQVKGFVKDGEISFLNKHKFNKINFTFDFSKQLVSLREVELTYNDLNFLLDNLDVSNVDKDLLIKGVIKNKDFEITKKNINDIYGSNTLGIKKISLNSLSSFSFKVDKRLKFKNFFLNTEAKLNELILTNNYNLDRIFPDIKNEILLNDHKIKFNYNKNGYEIIGGGKILIQNNFDEINYLIKEKNDKLNFETTLEVQKNNFVLDLLNFEKKNKNSSSIYINAIRKKDKSILINNFLIKDKKNIIELKNVSLSKNYKLTKMQNAKFDYFDRQNKRNIFDIIYKNKNYSLNGKELNADYLITRFINSNNDKKLGLFEKKLKIDVNLDKVLLDDKSQINNFNGNMSFKNGEVIFAELVGSFSDQKKLKYTVNSIDDQKISTLFSDEAEPFLKRYKFIKGFNEGKLDYHSVKKDGSSLSQIKIYDFKLKEVPVLTKILSLASLQGIADLVSGEGIRFNEFEMNFENRKSLISIEEIYAIGPAISILMKGYVEKNKLVSLRGTLVPATTINKVIGSIPVLGKILVGSKTGEGVFGVSFKIKGPPKNLETTVNPIKTLTPRFITRTLEKIKKN